MSEKESSGTRLARKVAAAFGALPSVEAVALGGSQARGQVDTDSDIDMYVFTTSAIPLPDRKAIMAKLGALRPKFNPTPFWDVFDRWEDAETNIEVEAIYWGTIWTKGMLDRVLVKHQASNGYSTAHWHTIRNSICLYDRSGWFAALQDRSKQPYPKELRRAIVARNHPLLRHYRSQIGKAIRRGDLVSVNHRLTGLLESYFDVVFALSHALHPGEKRLLESASERCVRGPANMRAQVEAVLRAASSADHALLVAIDELIAGLDALLREEGLNSAAPPADRPDP